MDEKRCYYCGSDQWEERKIEYLYRHKDAYLLVRDMPVEVCVNCGMIYYPGAALEAVERLFFAIQKGAAAPDRHLDLPIAEYASIVAQNGNLTHDQLPVP
ncbi:MAG: type II toxin-antitoxin system MqsA family antitoxin [Chloroflexia bacterium]